jgi:serine/threonine protein kinase
MGLATVVLARAIYRLHKESKGPTSFATPGEAAGTDDISKRNWKIDFNDLEMGALIAKGVTGKVFKARWRGLTVAVKELIHTAQEEQITSELNVLIRVRHPTLVLFMGIAQPSKDKLCIVNEFMSKGSLYSVLHDKSLKLDWRRRMTMALDTARAMNYLHFCKPPILHRQLNSVNVLVDKELVVCDACCASVRVCVLVTFATTISVILRAWRAR